MGLRWVVSVFTCSVAIFSCKFCKRLYTLLLAEGEVPKCKPDVIIVFFPHQPASFFLSFFQGFPLPPPPKAPGHFVHHHFPCASRKGPCEGGGPTPWSTSFPCLSGQVSFQIQYLESFLSLLNSSSCQTDIKGGHSGCLQDTDT